MALEDKKNNDSIESSRLQSLVLDYKKTQKLVKCGKIAIIVILILLLIFALLGINFLGTSDAIGTNANMDFPYIGENGNWYVGGEDTGISAQGESPYIGDNGNWFIGDVDTGISASGEQGEDGSVPYIGPNGNWFINGVDTGISASGSGGSGDGKDGAKGDDGKDGLTPYIGENGNWFIGDKDTGVSASGGGNNNPGTGDFVNPQGDFTVSIDPNQGNKSIAVSETRGFANPTHTLSTIGIPNTWNITLADIPNGVDSDAGGAKNGQDYFVYTFFLKNTGTETLDYNERLTLMDNDLDAVKAVRFALYRDGERTIYASPAANGQKEDFACDEAFTGDINLIDKDQTGLTPGQIVRYTVVVWFEGNDPECVNNILGGSAGFTLGFKVK